MDLHKQFKEETKQDAYYLDQTRWNDYYIEWLESKIEQLPIHDVVGSFWSDNAITRLKVEYFEKGLNGK